MPTHVGPLALWPFFVKASQVICYLKDPWMNIVYTAMVEKPTQGNRGQIAPRYDIEKVMQYIKEKNGGMVPAYDKVRSKMQQLRVADRNHGLGVSPLALPNNGWVSGASHGESFPVGECHDKVSPTRIWWHLLAAPRSFPWDFYMFAGYPTLGPLNAGSHVHESVDPI
ncbi:hypothetical protein B0H14DRAFT_3441301 [Mycena olivaceomarginata]|nr:hypothetical protein B0H14DRAFT_3441301 [Mycena olivaceomarginata]